MLRTDSNPPTFKRGLVLPVVAYLTVLALLSALTLTSGGGSRAPLLGVVWGVGLATLGAGALKAEGVSLGSVLPSARTVAPVALTLVAFWTLYNLAAFGLAVGGVTGFDSSISRVVVHPLPYIGALLSSLLFTALPEELFFRTYLQQKAVSLAGGTTHRAVTAGIAIAAVLFAAFHLPRWFLASGHGVGAALAVRLLGLTLAGFAYGLVYALTGNLWLVAFFHATMNQRPLLITMQIPSELHLLVGIVEYAAMVVVVYLFVRATESDGPSVVWSRGGASSVPGE
jgi:membrane protease YdiL (CAAX protease family)